MSRRSGEILPRRDRRRHQRADHRIEMARRWRMSSGAFFPRVPAKSMIAWAC